ncbi:MAG: hypothetical protein ACI9LM_005604, partial [Alteromonadaceae bacterium]
KAIKAKRTAIAIPQPPAFGMLYKKPIVFNILKIKNKNKIIVLYLMVFSFKLKIQLPLALIILNVF